MRPLARKRFSLSPAEPMFANNPTGEISADSVFAWMLQWADASLKEERPGLHELGKELLQLVFDKAGVELPEVDTIRANLDRDGVRMWALINSRTVLVIETLSRDRDWSFWAEQCRSAVSYWVEGVDPILVFVETGSLVDSGGLRRAGIPLVSRDDLVDLLLFHPMFLESEIVAAFFWRLARLNALDSVGGRAFLQYSVDEE